MTSAHVGELRLRRFRAGELPAEEATQVTAHTQECGPCRAKLRAAEEEQRSFEASVPFDRFAAGVERAVRRPPPRRSLRWVAPVLSTAAALLVVLTAAPLLRTPSQPVGTNRLKGGAEVVVQVGGGENGATREAAARAPEPLAPGERVRIGYKGGDHRFLTSVSIDDRGEVTALYPESGKSLPVTDGTELQYLPESLDFTGAGLERIVVVLSDEALEVEQVKDAARAAFRDGGGLANMGRLTLPGEQFTRTVQKP